MNLPPDIKFRRFDANGNPLVGGKLYTYQSETTTPQATYTDQGGGTANANPVVLDANGEANVWLNPNLSYKFYLTDANDVPQWTVDKVVGLLTVGAVDTASLQDLAVTTAKLADDAVTSAKLSDSATVDADRAISTNHIKDGVVTLAKLDSVSAVSLGALMNASFTATVGANALTFALKAAVGTTASATNPVKIPFRSSTATDGAPVVRSVTGALSVVISSGSTLGHTSANPWNAYLYAIDNAGTVELAVSTKLYDEGSVQSTTAEGGAGGADSASALYSTTARTGVPIRLIGRIVSTQAAAGTWATSPSELALAPFARPQAIPQSEVWLSSITGYGVTSTEIRTFGTVSLNVGTAITYTSDADQGDKFTINENGIYSISYVDNLSASEVIGISKNSNQLATGVTSITAAHRLIALNTSASGTGSCAALTTWLSAGDIIRAHTNGQASGASAYAQHFRITRIA